MKLLRQGAIESMWRTTGKTLGQGVCSHTCLAQPQAGSDPPGEKKAGDGVQRGVSAQHVPPGGDSLLDPIALGPFAHMSPWEWLTPLVLAPAAALALARDAVAQQVPDMVPGFCQLRLQ